VMMINLFVKLTGPWSTQAFGRTLFWVCLWVCFWMILTSESVDWVKQIALSNVDGLYLVNWKYE
jgi:hypothetical protein